MVRRKIDIKPIEDSAKRHTTFTKRRQGLMKKAEDLFKKTDSEGAVIVFSKAANGYVLAHPNIDTVMARYEAADALAREEEINGDVEELVHGMGEEKEEEDEEEDEEEEEAELTEVQKRIGEATEKGGWKEAVGDLGVEELDELYAEIEKIKGKVGARVREIVAAAEEKDIPEGGSSVGDSSRGCSD